MKDFGALGNGTTDDTAAIQAALDVSRPADGWEPASGKCVYLPKANYKVTAPVRFYTGSCVTGDGPASRLVADPAFVGTAILKASPASSTNPTALTHVTIRDIGCSGGSGLWCVDLSPQATVTQVELDGITFWTSKGVNAASYLQDSKIRRLYGYGAVDQMLWVRGNHNRFEDIDKEGSSGTTTDPYILIERYATGRSQGNRFRGVLVEQATSANKTLFRADGTDSLVLEDLWFEPTLSDGYALRLIDSSNFQVQGTFEHLMSGYSKVSVVSSWGSFEAINSDSEDIPWSSQLEVDSASHVRVGRIFSRRSSNLFPLATARNVSIDEDVNKTLLETSPVPGVSAVSRRRDVRSENLLSNPSFEGGIYAWCRYGGTCPLDYTYTVDAAEVADGLMLNVTSISGTGNVYQRVTIPSSWVGQTLTFSYLAKITGDGYMVPGVECTTNPSMGVSGSRHSGGWQLLSVTFTPQAAGTCDLVAWWLGAAVGTTHVYLDEARLGFGTIAQPGGGTFKQIELGTRSVLSAAAAPTTGTWKQGDLVFNSTPSAGSPFGWRAIAAGTPGTWEPMYVHTTAP